MDTTQRRDHRRALRIGAATAALAATMITGGVVSAQTSSTTPDTQTQTTPAVPGDQQAFGGPNGGRRGDRGGPNHGFGQGSGGQGFGQGSGGQGSGGQGFGQGSGGQGFGQGFGQGSGGQMGGRGDFAGMGRNAVTVTSNDGTSLGLETSDGWTRTIDTTGVVLTDDGATIVLADIAVGDDVSIAQTRNADGSYTVTGIAVLPMTVRGTVASVDTDSFSVTLADGTTQTVNVTAATTWRVQGSTAPGIADLIAGRQVGAMGDLAADGSLDATMVVAR